MELTLSQKVGKKLRKMREERDWNQYNIAESVGISESSYGKIGRGEVSITLERLEELAKIFDITPTELVCEASKIVNNIQHNQNGTQYGFNVNLHGVSAPQDTEREKLLIKNEALEKENALLRELYGFLQGQGK